MNSHRQPGFDFFKAGELPAPQISEAAAQQLAANWFRGEVTAQSLGSQQDANFLLRGPTGSPAGVLKVANGAFAETEIRAQVEAAALVARNLPQLRVATVLEHPLADEPARLIPAGSRGEVARVVRFLDGGTLSGSGYLSQAVIERLGALSGAVNRTLAGFEHTGVHRTLQWDMRHATRVIDQLVHHVGDPERRRVVEQVRASAGGMVEALSSRLPVQVIHGDMTDDNVVRSVDGSGIPDGLIDFGDLNMGWSVADLAVTVSSILHHDGATPVSTLPAIRAFHSERPLSSDEIEALWPLVLLRGAVLVVSGWQQTIIDDDNEYARSALEHEWRILENALTVPADVMSALLADELDVGLQPLALPEGFGTMLAIPVDAVVIDLSVDSDSMDEGAWLGRAREAELASEGLSHGAAAVATAHLQTRLTRSSPLQPEAPRTVPTGIDVWFARDTELRAPWTGRVSVGGHAGVSFENAQFTLAVRADKTTVLADATTDLIPGQPMLHVPAGTRVRITVSSSRLREVPEFVPAAERKGWQSFVADPGPLFGITPAREDTADDPDQLVRRREQHFATLQEHYYRNPPRIERGWRHTLIDSDGRCYLDMVNNVAALGHAHPGVERAVTRQLRRLNTNSRFNYGSVVEFSERLTALLPSKLDTVFLVNSGSEANDLAIRIALATTGRPDLLAVSEAYHGWTLASDAVSTSVADNPSALETRPEWVHTLDAPNQYRGRHRGADARRYGEEAVETIRALATEGRDLAGFICEAYYGNAGGMALPDGYLKQVYAAVREQGGLTIADEVQVGYGRLGEWFWGF